MPRSIRTRPAVRGILVAGALIAWAGGAPPRRVAAQETAAASRPTYGYDPGPDFRAFEPRYRERKADCRAELDRLRDEMIAQQRKRRKTPCTRQVYLEAKWLVQYTADFDRAERRLRDLRDRLEEPADPHDGDQVAADGSYGCCSEVWFHKLDATVDQLIARALRLRRPKHPLALLDRINDPDELRAYLDSVRIADVRARGVDTRYELNSATSALTRLILWSGTLRSITPTYTWHPKLKETLLDYEDNTWQDPETGYWGTWYHAEGGRMAKTADLSTTFHIVHFRQGRVKRWPEIVRTTLAIKDDEYPYGWLEDGRMSNHHNYDVVTIFRLGWPHAGDEQRARIRVEVARMLEWCLGETLEADGSFRIRPSDAETLGAAFYFGVSFLNEVGYFSRRNRFWTDRAFPEAAEVRDRIKRRIEALELDDPESQWALLILDFAG